MKKDWKMRGERKIERCEEKEILEDVRRKKDRKMRGRNIRRSKEEERSDDVKRKKDRKIRGERKTERFAEGRKI